MYYQKIIVNSYKYVIQSSYIFVNICLLKQTRNKFITYLPQINKIKKNYDGFQWNNLPRTKVLISGSFLFNLFSPKEEKDDTEELKMTIKRSILLIQKQEFQKAEQMLHLALRQAQTLQHYDVLKRLIAKGVPQDDLAVIHISLKIADIYDKSGDIEKADDGYKFCLHHLQNHLVKDNENKDVLQLLGLNLEKYGSMLFTQLQYTNALKYFSQAYDISVKINGEEDEQTVILLNNLGNVCYMLQKYDQAIEYLSKAAELGKKLPDMNDLGIIHVNLGKTLVAKGLYEEGKKSCTEAEYLARARKDDESIIEAKKCLEQIKNLTQ
ncbi:tetratricopeptide repeat domain 19 isoform X2 [Xylocopa sonorina]|uniref:tetratricopeptide repeat domain 19 isoform X2 n=1 Tax=Xylocopa sonorina TaxID=1818115 RepID=UPI00403AE910